MLPVRWQEQPYLRASWWSTNRPRRKRARLLASRGLVANLLGHQVGLRKRHAGWRLRERDPRGGPGRGISGAWTIHDDPGQYPQRSCGRFLPTARLTDRHITSIASS